jgi:lipopolysaccharide export system protein LptA
MKMKEYDLKMDEFDLKEKKEISSEKEVVLGSKFYYFIKSRSFTCNRLLGLVCLL